METMQAVNCRTAKSSISGDFLDKLSSSARQDLESIQTPSNLPANKVIFTEREASRGVYIVLAGEIKLSINSQDGKRLCLRIARAGEILGLASTLSGGGYELSAETLYPVRTAHIGRTDFLNFLARHPDAYRAVTHELSRHVNIACERLRDVGLSSSAPEKLARLLLDWSENGNTTECGTRFRFCLTHEQIGEFIGASRETVTRTMGQFKDRRLVGFQGSMMTIHNRAALASYARG